MKKIYKNFIAMFIALVMIHGFIGVVGADSYEELDRCESNITMFSGINFNEKEINIVEL